MPYRSPQRSTTRRLRTASRLTWSILCLAATISADAADPILDSPMYDVPKITIPDPIIVFRPELKTLWLKALARPEADLQHQAADAFVRARRLGMKDLDDVVKPLTDALNARDQHPVVRQSAARALVALDAKQSAPSLFRHLSAEGLAYAQIVEPALAKWDYGPVRKLWLQRLGRRETRSGYLRLAIRGVATVGEGSAADALWKLAGSTSTAPQIRLEAARALGRIEKQGLVGRANRLASDKTPAGMVGRLVAASLLARQTGEPAQKLLQQLAVDPQPAVGGIALRRLHEIDSGLILPLLKTLLNSRDAEVRRLAARALVDHPSTASVAQLGPLLDDRHPNVRTYVRSTFIEWGRKRPGLKAALLAQATRQLQGESWRGQEQAALVFGALDHEPAAKRLIALMESKRPEVMVATAWALRKLALPETLPAMLDRAKRQTDSSAKLGTPGGGMMPLGMGFLRDGYDEQIRQLFQAFGQMNYREAIPLLRRYVPKAAPFAGETRGAAIWALGHIDLGSQRAAIEKAIIGRLADAEGLYPELPFVRQMCAAALGWMKSKAALPTLRRYDNADEPIGLTCRWGIERITGEKLPGPKPGRFYAHGWFLEPTARP